jgi:hypothetical protein
MENGAAIYAGCLSTFPSTSSTIVTVRQDPKKSTQVQGPITMWAQPITVQLQSSDSSLFVSSTATTAASSTSGVTATQPTIAHPTETAFKESTSSESSGLSTGAGIGVGVGVGVGGFTILAAIGLWFLRRRRRATKNLRTVTVPHEFQGTPSYHGVRKVNVPPAELDTYVDRPGNNAHELGG